MSHGNNDNDNVNVGTTSNNNINDNVKYEKGRKVEIIADQLLKKLKLGEDSRDFMCKVGWTLSEARIWSNLEKALKGGSNVKNPVGLFIYLCKRDGV